MADWTAIATMATAAGTTVLAVATFGATRSSNRSARIAEDALLAQMRPLLVPSLADDPARKVLWGDLHTALLPGGRALVEVTDDVVYLAIGLRNGGSGMALLHGWYLSPSADLVIGRDNPALVDDFRRLSIDLYIPSNGAGYWEAAVRGTDDPLRAGLVAAATERTPFTVELLYGDQHGAQRAITRFAVLPAHDDGWYAQANRHWNVDRPDPR